MKNPIRLRMTDLLTAVAAMLVVMGVFEWLAWRQIKNLQARLQPADSARIDRGNRYRAALFEMHQAWRSAIISSNTTSPSEVAASAQTIDPLLRQDLHLNASSGSELVLKEFAGRFAAYQELAREALSNMVARDDFQQLMLERQVEANLIQLLALAEKIDSSDQSAAKPLADASGALTRLHTFLIVSMAGLVLCGAVAVTLVYRRVVGPLHSRLAETRTLMERQEKLASLGVFAAGIAHEVRNPITAIKVRLFTLKGSHQPNSSESEDLQVIESEINRLERIVQEFLRFARPAEPELQMVPVDRFLREVHGLVLPDLNKKGITFELELSDNATARIDPEKMKQVLINLLQNAKDSIEGEGSVTLRSRTGRATIDNRTVTAVVIEVSDTGKGMTPEVESRLFDPFFTTKEKGTGLGLPIAARIVEKHGGLMQYRTRVGRGTTFSILLPRQEA